MAFVAQTAAAHGPTSPGHPRPTQIGATALLGCEPSEIMLVASHKSDLAAAAACGLRTCYVSRTPGVRSGVAVEEPPAKGRFDLMVEDLLELSRRAGC
jgi:2-haloacid dehalogenase